MNVVVYAICKNEAQFVDRWMDSMGEADQVVVLDTGSEDDTVERLRAAPAAPVAPVAPDAPTGPVGPVGPWTDTNSKSADVPGVPLGLAIRARYRLPL